MGDSLEQRVARLALDAFHALPARCKPRWDPPAGVCEWVPMSAVVLAQNDGVLHLASLATGSKCLPAAILPEASGLVLHDSHAEILALRALNRFLLQDAQAILLSPHYASPFLERVAGGAAAGTFELRPSVSIHLFSTEPPCGDASMEFIMAAQQDATPWLPPAPNPSFRTPSLPGRSYFSSLAVVRRKPSRPDAPPSLSKSCTDKLTLKQFTSVLSSPSTLLISPRNAYISTFTVPFDKYNPEGYARAFTSKGRLSTLEGDLRIGPYAFNPFKVTPLPQFFELSYPCSKPAPEDTTIRASNISVLHINHPTNPTTEVLISGVKQGNGQLSTSRDNRKGSAVCRKKLYLFLREVVELSGNEDLKRSVANLQCYRDLKINNCERNEMKNRLIDALCGWERNIGDDEWLL